MIAGNKVKLRSKKISDARDDYSWQTDIELSRLDATTALDMSFTQYLSEFTFELCYPTANRHEFAIETLDGKHIGNCVYYNVDTAVGTAELGIMIGDRNYWSKGYGVDSVNSLLKYIFKYTSNGDGTIGSFSISAAQYHSEVIMIKLYRYSFILFFIFILFFVIVVFIFIFNSNFPLDCCFCYCFSFYFSF